MMEVFSAEAFVEDLLAEGSKVYCDESNQSFRSGDEKDLPPFYNEEKFKRGQKFYHRHLVSMLLGKLMGLITILAIPTISSVLEFTKMSSDSLTAYKRYLGTLFHMTIWYDEEFTPGSNLWKSLQQVKNKHNVASKRSCMNGLGRISQKDMALTQFGFMGLQIARSEQLGIYGAEKGDFEDFIHVWKVVGHLMGIEDRFNICRDSYEETRLICDCLIKRVLNPAIQQNSPSFSTLSRALVDGMWCMVPYLEYDVFTTKLLELLQSDDDPVSVSEFSFERKYAKLSRWQRFQFGFITRGLWALKNSVYNYVQRQGLYLAFYLMRNCPFLAYYKFGKANSFVHVLDAPARNHQSG